MLAEVGSFTGCKKITMITVGLLRRERKRGG